jgi:hypothetical protein
MKSYKEQYAQDGYLSPLQIIDGHQAALSRKALEEAESVFGPFALSLQNPYLNGACFSARHAFTNTGCG